jgi:L-alanine-DL-glutamate epimerase-like enolase superfamily enzyme
VRSSALRARAAPFFAIFKRKEKSVTPRRTFLKQSLWASTALLGLGGCTVAPSEQASQEASELLRRFQAIAKTPVLQRDLISEAIVIDDLGVYRHGKHFFLQVRSKAGHQGTASMKPKYAERIFPLVYEMVSPVIKGEDARRWDELLREIYIQRLNYKWQGLAFWVTVAYVELAVLDMLGRACGKPIGTLLGGRVRDRVDIYYASGNRGNSPEEEVEYLQQLVEESGAKAVKYRLGARMHYTEASNRRDEALIPLVRQTLGDDAVIYTDANGSFDVPRGIATGRMLQDYGTAFFEEPCPFDYYQETQAVARALEVPIAGGEQESSMRRFMDLLETNTLRIVQPDLLFFGGLVRAIKVARMAQVLGRDCTPHISSKGLGFLYMMHFASCVPNIGPYQEFKGNKDGVPVSSPVPLEPKNGQITIPDTPGLGVTFDPDFLQNAQRVNPL